MVLHKYRKEAGGYLKWAAKYFENTNPNTLTWAAFVCAILASISFILTRDVFDFIFVGYSYVLLFVASVFIFLNAGFDALDGWIARERGIASKRGDFLDHVLDRYADFFMLGGITLSRYCNPFIGVMGMFGVFFTSYMGTQSQALGLKRDYSGVLGRADRLVLLMAFPVLQMVLVILGIGRYQFTLLGQTVSITSLDILMLWFALAGHGTAVHRAYNSWKSLEK